METATLPNQQKHAGLIYVNYQLPRIMTRDELSKAIIYLIQIHKLAVNNNADILEFHQEM
jgi:hypothetical protein